MDERVSLLNVLNQMKMVQVNVHKQDYLIKFHFQSLLIVNYLLTIASKSANNAGIPLKELYKEKHEN